MPIEIVIMTAGIARTVLAGYGSSGPSRDKKPGNRPKSNQKIIKALDSVFHVANRYPKPNIKRKDESVSKKGFEGKLWQ